MNRYDTIVVGGGVAGLMSGIALAESGRSVALFVGGRSSLDYFSGSFELLNEGMDGLGSLPSTHPYTIIGAERIVRYTERAKEIFASAGMPLIGGGERCEWRITPLGALKRVWLSLEEFATISDAAEYGSVCVVSIEGYLDFNAEFVCRPLRNRGVMCRIAMLPQCKSDVADFAQRVADVAEDAEMVILPAIFSPSDLRVIRKVAGKRVKVVPVASTSLAGRYLKKALVERFVALGGCVVEGEKVVSLAVENGVVRSLQTDKGVTFEAEQFVLATGSLFGGGIVASHTKIYEPLAGLDVDAPAERKEWTREHLFEEQPFEKFGVVVDEELHPSVGGVSLGNLYAVGAILAGFDGVREGSGGGVAICSALRAAELILE